MTYDQLEAFYLTQTGIANALQVSRQRVNGWKNRKTVPLDMQIQAEIASGRRLRADIPDQIRRIA